MQCPTTILLDGMVSVSMSALSVNVDAFDDGRPHTITLRSSPACGSGSHDDFGPVNVVLNDSVTGLQTVLAQGLIFEDGCIAPRVSATLPFSLGHAIPKRDRTFNSPVHEATGELALDPQLDL